MRKDKKRFFCKVCERPAVNDALFEAIYRHAGKHWWFRGRQRIVFELLDRHLSCAEQRCRVLELGCGPGNNLEALGKYGEVSGGDPSPVALDFCRQHFRGELKEIWLPERVPFPDESYDLVVMLDVLEHIEDAESSLLRVFRLLKPGGLLILTVPALQWLWSKHDEEHHHFRRYSRAQLYEQLKRGGFEIEKCSYYMFLLLPLMVAARFLLPQQTNSARNLESGTGFGGRILGAVLGLENHLLKNLNLPIGGSLVALARRSM